MSNKEALNGIVGNIALRKRLADDILANTLPHACIIEGKRGTGKHTIAKMTAAALHCSKKNDPSLPIPCMTCPECKKVLEGKSPDVITIGCEDKATFGVENVRFLKEDVHIIPNDSDKKIYIIEDADKMTIQAQNAFLLTLEEPPNYVNFFLLCENAGMFLETIRSRAPIMRTELISADDIDEYLCANDRRAVQMKLADPKCYAELLTASANGIGQALEYLEPKAFSPIRQTRALVSDFVLFAIEQRGAKKILPLLLRFSNKRDLLKTQLLSLSDALRDLILLKKSDDAPISFYCDKDEAIDLCDRTSLTFLYTMSNAVQAAIDENSKNANVRLMLIKMAMDSGLI